MSTESGSEGNGRYLPFLAILFLSGLIRFYNLMNPFNFPGYSKTLGNNGADEGVFLMAGKLASSGYRMYTDIHTQQGPLFSLVIELLQGDPLMVRSMTVLLSLAGILGMVLLSGGISNRRMAIASSMFLAFNYVYFKESRHVSFDLYAAVLLIFGFYVIATYFKELDPFDRGDRPVNQRTQGILVVVAGLLFSLAAMSKLFAVIPIISLGLYLLVMIVLDRSKRTESGVRSWHLVSLALSTLVPTLLLMSVYGFRNTLDGILLDNLQRPYMPVMDKVQTLLLFALFSSVPIILSFVAVSRDRGSRMTKLMLVWAVPLFIFIIIQSPLWEHYLVLLLPPICYLGGRGFQILVDERSAKGNQLVIGSRPYEMGRRSRSGQILIAAGILFLLISLCVETGLVFVTERALERDIAEEVELLSDEGDLIISGDPIIGVYANRLQPPEVANLAMVRHPPLSDEHLINATANHDVTLVVLTYELTNHEGYVDFIRQYFDFHRAYSRSDGGSEIEGEIPIDFWTFNIYVLRSGVDLARARDEFLGS
ncbi:MAG: hypothetical protein ACMUHU_06810 [Thermoplasmatota archaeon]